MVRRPNPFMRSTVHRQKSVHEMDGRILKFWSVFHKNGRLRPWRSGLESKILWNTQQNRISGHVKLSMLVIKSLINVLINVIRCQKIKSSLLQTQLFTLQLQEFITARDPRTQAGRSWDQTYIEISHQAVRGPSGKWIPD